MKTTVTTLVIFPAATVGCSQRRYKTKTMRGYSGVVGGRAESFLACIDTNTGAVCAVGYQHDFNIVLENGGSVWGCEETK